MNWRPHAGAGRSEGSRLIFGGVVGLAPQLSRPMRKDSGFALYRQGNHGFDTFSKRPAGHGSNRDDPQYSALCQSTAAGATVAAGRIREPCNRLSYCSRASGRKPGETYRGPLALSYWVLQPILLIRVPPGELRRKKMARDENKKPANPNQSHKPAKQIEETARLASSVETAKDPGNVRGAKD